MKKYFTPILFAILGISLGIYLFQFHTGRFVSGIILMIALIMTIRIAKTGRSMNHLLMGIGFLAALGISALMIVIKLGLV